MTSRNWEQIFEPDPAYPCMATSVEGLVQQVSVSYLRQGYTNFVTGRVPAHADPEKVDQSIIGRYGLNKDWRYRARLKQHSDGPIANVEYIRFGRFYVILGTPGEHLFYEREAERVRSCLRDPKRPSEYPFSEILVPANLTPPDLGRSSRWRAKVASGKVFQGYSIVRHRGCHKRKSTDERAEYRKRIIEWQVRTNRGEKIPKPRPGYGDRDNRLRSVVKLERRTEKRLYDAFVNIALSRSRANLEYEFRSTGFVPWSEVKNQLLGVLKAVNAKRRTAGGKHQELSYNTVLHLKRWQVHPFRPVPWDHVRFGEMYPSLAVCREQTIETEAA